MNFSSITSNIYHSVCSHNICYAKVRPKTIRTKRFNIIVMRRKGRINLVFLFVSASSPVWILLFISNWSFWSILVAQMVCFICIMAYIVTEWRITTKEANA